MRAALVVGSVVSLRRYPVKSMMGEKLDATEISHKGVVGDRAYALIEFATGKVVSAKNPRKWLNCLISTLLLLLHQ
ncbi:MOSC N-terminal beta barrel domain-containing protein [Chroogloeocystis siderophila]|uniref:MOSC N-terminal beta barrel domain-containing protein n=1 Tax=Chroogloeocystis siderophila TaxID=329163 RepID=UPI000A49C5DA|nr:MOSC N-terminal beta barrel domain-containing protein [Chroogloeocystis siderophila]